MSVRVRKHMKNFIWIYNLNCCCCSLDFSSSSSSSSWNHLIFGARKHWNSQLRNTHCLFLERHWSQRSKLYLLSNNFFQFFFSSIHLFLCFAFIFVYCLTSNASGTFDLISFCDNQKKSGMDALLPIANYLYRIEQVPKHRQ